jgi:uncharacterized protein
MSIDTNRTCDVWELARTSSTLAGDLRLADLPRLGEELCDVAGALSYRMEGRFDDHGRPAALLAVDGTVRVRCDRCGGAVDVPIHERAQFFFVAEEAELARLPIDDTPEEALLASHRFDVTALVEDQALLALPISPRHERCMAPAEDGEPAAPAADTHRPFEALAALSKRRH